MKDLPFPFFSPFSQIIDKFVNQPITNWSHFFSPSVVFNYNPEDEEIEQHVLRKVGSYGKQLGVLIDMVQLLRSQLPLAEDKLNVVDRETVKKFDRLAAEVEQAVSDFRGESSDQSVAAVVKQLSELKAANGEKFDEILKALNETNTNPALVESSS